MDLIQRKFDLKISPEDERDYNADVLISGSIISNIPDDFIISDKYKVYDQGTSSMCTAFSCAQVARIMDNKQYGTLKDFSYSYLYANRDTEDFQGEGHYISQVLKDFYDDGTCLLSQFNYIGTYLDTRTKFLALPQSIRDSAKQQKLRAYYKITGTILSRAEKAIKLMHQYQSPIVIGASLYKTVWQNSLTNGGIVECPNSESDATFGGHAMAIIGTKMINGKQYFVTVNSWGTASGNNGVFYINTQYPFYEMWLPLDYKKTILKFQVGNKNYTVNGGTKVMDTVPVNKDGKVYVPVRYLAETFDREVQWDATTKTITLKQVDDMIQFQIGSLKGMDLSYPKEITFDAPAYIDANGRTLVHTRSIANALGLTISWDDSTKTVTIQN